MFRFCFLHSYALLRVTICAFITSSRGKGSTVFCNLELHVLRRETVLEIWLTPGLNLTIFQGTEPRQFIMKKMTSKVCCNEFIVNLLVA